MYQISNFHKRHLAECHLLALRQVISFTVILFKLFKVCPDINANLTTCDKGGNQLIWDTIHIKVPIFIYESIQKIMTTFPSMFSVICNKYAEKIRLLPKKMLPFIQHYKLCMLYAVNRVDWVTAWTLSTEYNYCEHLQ